jgi:uncharacterized protein with von Willebrand factor type A (vWA) domain
VGFATALRRHGVVAGTSDLVDAGAVIQVLGMADRGRLREGLAAALLRRSGQRQVYDDLFDLWFPAALGTRTGLDADLTTPRDPADRRARAAALRDELAVALAAADREAIERLAARTVAELGRLPNDASTGSWSSAQALDLLAPQLAIAGAVLRMRDAADDVPGGRGDGSGGSGGSGSGTQGNPAGGGFADRFTRDELRAAVAEFRRRVEIESRRRNAEARGPERISRYAVRPPAEQTPFLLAGAAEVQELRSTITPLAKKLASRMAAKRRRAARGEIDIRKTLRRSMSTGGVPIRPALRRRSPHRPDLVLLCDLSSSVAGFSRFTILLMQAMAGQFRRIRIFGFVNVCDEVTDLVLSAPPGSDLTQTLGETARMTRWHRSSDYGSTFADFVDRYLDAVGPRSTVLILGDARTNNTEPRLDALAEIVARAKRVDWLNPESPSQWGAGDSVADLYGQIVDMHECANAVQLRQFVMRLMPV